jgi:RNA polymerase sigma factor (sigma-70 family)
MAQAFPPVHLAREDKVLAMTPHRAEQDRAEQDRAEQDRAEQDQHISWTFEQERRRLLAFIRRRIPSEIDAIDADDLLQDVFYELVEAYRMMQPIAHAGAWMMQVARNRITDLFRSRKPEMEQDGGRQILEDLLPSPEAGPDALYARSVLLAEIETALGELPPSQREVFLAHEIEGRSFADISAETGVSINTLLSRKHYAVKRLRARLRKIHDESGYERNGK